MIYCRQTPKLLECPQEEVPISVPASGLALVPASVVSCVLALIPSSVADVVPISVPASKLALLPVSVLASVKAIQVADRRRLYPKMPERKLKI